MNIEKVWAMPNKDTFSIKPVYEWIRLIIGIMGDEVWVDPFVRHSPFKWDMRACNDLNPEIEATHNMDALAFLKTLDDESVDGVFFDPPYSPAQIKECYDGIGIKVMQKDTMSSFYSDLKAEIKRITKPGAKVLCFGWNSGGLGKQRGFKMKSILLVAHGGNHHDTICTYEIKCPKQSQIQDFFI